MRAKMLTDAKARTARSRDKAYRLAAGGSLFLVVAPGGSKTWRYFCRDGERVVGHTLGRYPTTSASRAHGPNATDSQRCAAKEKTRARSASLRPRPKPEKSRPLNGATRTRSTR
jgi:hypothetical protein